MGHTTDMHLNTYYKNNESLLERVEMAERQRIFDTVHHHIGSLAGVKLALEVLQATENMTQDGVLELAGAIDNLDGISNEFRDLMYYFRPNYFDQLPFCEAVRWNCGRSNKSFPEIEISCDCIHTDTCKRIRHELFSIFREAFSNAIKHSGGDKIRIGISGDGQVMKFIVADNGIGGAKLPDCNKFAGNLSGLEIIRDRVRLLDGTVRLESGPDFGTSITVEVPLS